VQVTDEYGRQLRCPMKIEADVSWVGYANKHIRNLVEPVLRTAMQRHRLDG
jgi:hypothetical protein